MLVELPRIKLAFVDGINDEDESEAEVTESKPLLEAFLPREASAEMVAVLLLAVGSVDIVFAVVVAAVVVVFKELGGIRMDFFLACCSTSSIF